MKEVCRFGYDSLVHIVMPQNVVISTDDVIKYLTQNVTINSSNALC